MRFTSYAIILLAILSFPSRALLAQEGYGNTAHGGNSNYGINGDESSTRTKRHLTIEGKVITMAGDPVADAKVHVDPLHKGSKGQALKTDPIGKFETALDVYADPDPDAIHEFPFRVTIEKKGFAPARIIIHRGEYDTGPIEITLRPVVVNENLLSQEDLDSILGPRLKSLGPADGLSEKSAKDYDDGIRAYFDRNQSDEAIESFLKVARREKTCADCWAMLALAELDSGDLDGAMRDSGYGADLAVKNQRSRGDASTLFFGVLQTWKDNLGEAEEYLSQAVKADPSDVLALQELGRVQLQIHKWSDADATLAKAIAAGAGREARLLRVQALLGEYKTDEASHELAKYLGNGSLKGQPLRVHMLAERIDSQKKLQAFAAENSGNKDPLEYYTPKNTPELKGLVPATSQDALAGILLATGKNVAHFFQDFRNTSSLEVIHEEQGGADGVAKRKLDQKCQYICLTTGDRNAVHFREYRGNEHGGIFVPQGLNQGYMLTAGFASAIYLFHPSVQPQSKFRYLGRESVEGRPTDVVAFAQQPLKTQSPGTFRAGQDSVATYVKGLAWIDSQTHQIIRFRTDLLAPLMKIGLKSTRTQIEYKEVRFKASSEPLWLPQLVSVSVAWKTRTFHNEHRYSDFKLFDVNTHEKTELPKEMGQATKPDGDSSTSQ